MTNEQIQALRAAAEKAIADDWGYDRDEFSEIASPEAILSLLAERDADKALIAELKNDVDAANARVDAGCAQLCKQDDLIATLHDACSQWERKAISNFEECAEMSARIEELEARTVSVKLPESVIDAICLTAAEIHNLGRGVSDERAQEIINSIRCAAGITLVVGE